MERPAEKFLVIVNPKAGLCENFDLEALLQASLREEHFTLLVPESEESLKVLLTEKIQTENINKVLIAGGDGTIKSALPVLADFPEVVLGILPLGTGNLLAKNLGIPTNPNSALEVFLRGKVRAIDLGRINEHIFALNAGVGIDAEIMDKTAREAKKQWGFWAYIWEGGRQVPTHKPSKLRIITDGTRIQTRAIGVLCANVGSKLGAGLNIAPDSHPDDGLLDGTIFKMHGFWGALLSFFQLLIGRTGHRRDPVQHFHARKIQIEAFPPLKAQADGNVIGQTPVTIEIMPQKLKLLVP